MRQRLGLAARRARVAAGLRLIDITTELTAERGLTISVNTLSRFERGRHWPDHIEEIVETYERQCGLEPFDLWRRAANGDFNT